MAREEAVAGPMNGWGLVLVLAVVNFVSADTLVWFVIAQGWP